jgi:UDP-glucuronate 4-epimerase
MRILVTGAAGFIGFHTASRLLARGHEVIGVDNLNDYYDVRLKRARLAEVQGRTGFTFFSRDIADRDATSRLFFEVQPHRVIHLAAQAGVRYSISNPHAYVDSNLVGFVNVLEGCRNHKVQHLVYASSSSVYGSNRTMPFSVEHNVDHPLSLYAATKKANELMAHTYSHLYNLPTTGLRFFTVYGPWGRPDMAYFIFTRAIDRGEPINVFNHGRMLRDFTYIDDIVEGVVRACDRIARPNLAKPEGTPGHGAGQAPYRIYNIGTHRPVALMRLIEIIEENLGKVAQKNFLPMQPGDVPSTYADVEDLRRDVGFEPSTPLEEGIRNFVEWYRAWQGRLRVGDEALSGKIEYLDAQGPDRRQAASDS